MKKLILWAMIVAAGVWFVYPMLDQQTQKEIDKTVTLIKTPIYNGWFTLNVFMYEMAGQTHDEAIKSAIKYNDDLFSNKTTRAPANEE